MVEGVQQGLVLVGTFKWERRPGLVHPSGHGGRVGAWLWCYTTAGHTTGFHLHRDTHRGEWGLVGS